MRRSHGSVLAQKNRSRLPLRVVKTRYFECLAFPLSGGFSYRAVLPAVVLRGFHKLEQTRLFQNRVVSIRVLTVLEKFGVSQPSETDRELDA